MVFNATYNNISDISSVLLVEETGVKLKIEQHEPTNHRCPEKVRSSCFTSVAIPVLGHKRGQERNCDYEKLNTSISVVFRDTGMP